MRAHLILPEAVIRGRGVDVFDVLLRPEPFTIKLLGAPDGLRWFVENDPVLDHVEAPDKKSSEITATGVGTSIIHIELGRGDRSIVLHKMIVTVYDDSQTVTVGMKFQDVRPVEGP